MPSVLLLRAPSQDGSTDDKYDAAFRALGYHALSVPVLETVLVNIDDLTALIHRGPDAENGDGALAGVVVTSARACEAWRRAVDTLSSDPSCASDWSQTPFYAVGQSTAHALSDIRRSSRRLAPHDVRGAAHAGTSERLAHFILHDLDLADTHTPARKKTLLYLTGDKNRDTLPNVLSAGGVDLAPLKVYETRGSSTFAADLQAALSSPSTPAPQESWWIVFFAPSAADFVLPTLRTAFAIPNLPTSTSTSDSPDTAPRARARIAAIGPTTASFLTETLNVRVDVVAPQPTPEALANAISRFCAEPTSSSSSSSSSSSTTPS